ncbi:MAG: IclR family transcriptional regulator [Kiritimatiellales bacterium]|nr:IclR family transcriptional regulator [Kiritimatiellales bacterium]
MGQTGRKTEKPNFQVPNLERGLLILERLREHEEGIRLSGLASSMGFPANSVMRIMNAMEYHGYVSRDPQTKKYMLSRKLFSLAYGSAGDKSLMENSLDVMRQLRDELNETIVLSIVSGSEGLVLDQVQARHPFRFVCDPGTRQPLHASAPCKTILALMPEARLVELLKGMPFTHFTRTTITSRKAYREELDGVRKKGYAVDRAEALEGVHCVAAPILDYRGDARAAITVTGPSNRLKVGDFPRVGKLLKVSVSIITKRNGFGL